MHLVHQLVEVGLRGDERLVPGAGLHLLLVLRELLLELVWGLLASGHVIEDVNELEITNWTNGIYKAEDWYRDPDNDCGIIVVDGILIDVAEFANSNEAEIGDEVFCIGSPLGKLLFNTVTHGRISGIGRILEFFGEGRLITVDITIDYGSSGGPLFNTDGKIIGIATG